MIGTLARGQSNGGGRRTEVDAQLGSVAAAYGLPFVSVRDWLTRYGLAKEPTDAVHMNPAGRHALGLLLQARLRTLGLGPKHTGTGTPTGLKTAGAGATGSGSCR